MVEEGELEKEVAEESADAPLTIHAPFWSRIKDSKRILLSGCGGGFDVYQSLPLFFTLRQMGYEVFLANYTYVLLRH